MPRFAHVRAEVPCPRCGVELAEGGAIGFQWGYCPNPFGGAYFTYEVGGPVLWRRDRRGDIPAWVYFRGGDANIGDPAFPDLVVRESEFDIRSCSVCGLRLDGIGVTIHRGVLAAVRAFETGGSLPECDVAIRSANGPDRPMPEWDDHPMASGVDGGWRCRLVAMPDLPPIEETT